MTTKSEIVEIYELYTAGSTEEAWKRAIKDIDTDGLIFQNVMLSFYINVRGAQALDRLDIYLDGMTKLSRLVFGDIEG